jgi:IrrE N-terminal-like domain
VSRALTLPEQLLQSFGIDEAGEIDLEAIAWALGARVKYRVLHACEARLVGQGDRAIISVDSRVTPRRRRFSIGHELGHWKHHRGRCLICRSEDIGNARRAATDPERVADDYASDLLLPRYILEPMLRSIQRPTLKAAREVGDAFDASLTATLIKIVETDSFPMLLVCHGRSGRRWFRRSASVPDRWFPKEELDHESSAFELLFGGAAEPTSPSLIGADAWFDRSEASRYELLEQPYTLPNNEICTVLILSDKTMLSGT